LKFIFSNKAYLAIKALAIKALAIKALAIKAV